jgi:uncharacterized protein YdiU (UPF0061 family)
MESANLKFRSDFVNALPGDPVEENRPRQVKGACYSRVNPTPLSAPKLISFSKPLAQQLGLPESWLRSQQAESVLGGNEILPGMIPYAMCYGGHQFGNWAGQLGDGRAINLGEYLAPDGQTWTWQLKGAGKTPYSRFGDGLAVLRSSLREYLCSEAMFHLGVPTTRALSLIGTGALVIRDMFYDGNPKREPGAIVCRIAPSFLRFGNYEILAAQKNDAILRQLVDYTISRFFPDLEKGNPNLYESWFTEVAIRTARLVIHWMRVGFVHGVMNTDNMSILGLTIDYGPYGWIDHYDPDWTPNTTDAEGRRYSYGNQPQIAQWNLIQLANSIYPLFSDVDPLQRGLDTYVETIEREYRSMQLSKLGLKDDGRQEKKECIAELERLFSLGEIDMTIFFRKLGDIPIPIDLHAPSCLSEYVQSWLAPAFYDWDSFIGAQGGRLIDWLKSYLALADGDEPDRVLRKVSMDRVNPRIVVRNYMAQQAIEAAEKGDFTELENLMKAIQRPYDDVPESDQYFAKRPDWARTRAGCSMLSCSS